MTKVSRLSILTDTSAGQGSLRSTPRAMRDSLRKARRGAEFDNLICEPEFLSHAPPGLFWRTLEKLQVSWPRELARLIWPVLATTNTRIPNNVNRSSQSNAIGTAPCLCKANGILGCRRRYIVESGLVLWITCDWRAPSSLLWSLHFGSRNLVDQY